MKGRPALPENLFKKPRMIRLRPYHYSRLKEIGGSYSRGVELLIDFWDKNDHKNEQMDEKMNKIEENNDIW